MSESLHNCSILRAHVIAHFRTQSLQVFPYLGNILFVAASHHELKQLIQVAVSTLQSAGFVINFNKSSLHPTQDLVFLGACFLMASAFKTRHARLFLRPIQLYFLLVWNKDTSDLIQMVVLSAQVQEQLQW